MPDCCRKSYARGYQAGYKWPAHKPPIPPHPVVARLIKALIALRDCADAQMATFDEDDAMVKAFDPFIDEADAALISVRTWLINSDDPSDAEGGG